MILDLDGQVQEAVALWVGGVDVRPGLQQVLGHRDLARPQGHTQGGQVVRVTEVQVRGQQRLRLVVLTVFWSQEYFFQIYRKRLTVWNPTDNFLVLHDKNYAWGMLSQMTAVNEQ